MLNPRILRKIHWPFASLCAIGTVAWIMLFVLAFYVQASDIVHIELSQDYTFMARQSELNPIVRKIELSESQEKALGAYGSPYLADVVGHPSDYPWDGKLYLPGGWCSARAWDEDVWFIVTACHCVYNLSSSDSAVFETYDGARYSGVGVWITQKCRDFIQTIPTPQDGAILKVMPMNGSPGPAGPAPTRPPPFECSFRNCQQARTDLVKDEIEEVHTVQSIPGPGYELIVATGFPVNVYNGRRKYKLTSIPVRDFDETTYLFGGNLGPGMSGAGVVCSSGNPPPGQREPANVLCGIVTIFATDNGGNIYLNGAAYLEDSSGPWFERLLNAAGVQ